MSLYSSPADNISLASAPDPEVSPLVLITYIEHTQMCRSGWGTDGEIRVAATLFQSDILVFSESEALTLLC